MLFDFQLKYVKISAGISHLNIFNVAYFVDMNFLSGIPFVSVFSVLKLTIYDLVGILSVSYIRY